ncbi:hypothetical protein [Dyella psychrodurans]|uniref:Lipoprotein n=1 Tax=Dyella psychrodurans TaxID=1927960 RepID=A0A370X039_9GAMM|nr:hypothetical protein [Dyella psychrodurans]RDS81778.1 hypothetical protein DWU99_15215 [Dyella psychrodurans]
MSRAVKCLTIAAVAWMGVHAARCLADETTVNRTSDAREIYSAFLAQWMGKDDVPMNVANTAVRPTPEDIRQYNECASGGTGRAVHWITGTSDSDLNSALSSFTRVKLVDLKRWQPVDPGDLIAKGGSVGAAVNAGIANGLMTLSAISFNEAHDTAMLTFSFVCGGLCGHGGAVMFKMTSKGWVQDKQPCSSWIS